MTISKPKRSKRFHNTVFDRNELAIQNAILSLFSTYRGRITARQVAKAAGLSRQTIYNHHADIHSAIVEGEEYILDEFPLELDRQSQRLTSVISDHNSRLFYASMIFMALRRENFCPLCAGTNNHGVLHRMAEQLYSKLIIPWLPKGSPIPAVGSERADMLICMMVEVICKWSVTTHCSIRKGDRYVRRLLRAVAEASDNRLP